jgi:hypothetical protein
MEFDIFSLLLHVLHIHDIWYIFVQQSREAFVNGRQQTQTQWYYVAYMGSRTSEKIFTDHREVHLDASADQTVFLTLK